MNRTLVGLNAAVFIMMLGVGIAVPFLAGRVIGFTGSNTAVGFITLCYAISSNLIQVPMGALSDRLGYKRFLIAGYLLCTASGLLYFFSKSSAFIFVGRMIQGAGEAPLWALAPAILSIQFPQAKGRVMGLYNASLHIGLTVGPLLGIGALKLFGARADDVAFLFFSFACLVAAAIVAASVENPPQESDRKETVSFKNILALASDRTILAVFLGITLYGVGYGITITSVPAYMLRFKGYDQTFLQLFFIAFYLAISASQVISGPLSDKWGRERFMVCGLAVGGLFMALFPAMGSVGTIATLTVASLGLGTFYLASMAYLNGTVSNAQKGAISGAYFLVWGIGYFAGPMIVGNLGELWRGSLGFYCYAAALLLESFVLVFAFRKKGALVSTD